MLFRSDPEPVDVAVTATVAFAVVVPPGFTAESVYTVVAVGDTVTDVPTTVPTPLLTLVELAFETTHERTALCPVVIDAGSAVNDVIVGAAWLTVALQVVVATVDDASVACRVIEYVPGDTASVCDDVVAPLPQRNVTGLRPPAELAVQVMFVAVGAPAHEAVNADAAPANENRTSIATAPTDTIFLCTTIRLNFNTTNVKLAYHIRGRLRASA